MTTLLTAGGMADLYLAHSDRLAGQLRPDRTGRTGDDDGRSRDVGTKLHVGVSAGGFHHGDFAAPRGVAGDQLDDGAQGRGVPVGVEEVEVERLVHLVGAHVAREPVRRGDPGLTITVPLPASARADAPVPAIAPART